MEFLSRQERRTDGQDRRTLPGEKLKAPCSVTMNIAWAFQVTSAVTSENPS